MLHHFSLPQSKIMAACCLFSSFSSNPPCKFLLSSTFNGFLGYPSLQTHQTPRKIRRKPFQSTKKPTNSASKFKVRSGFLPVDPWAPNIDSQSIASQLFAASLFPYLGFLYFITKSKTAPKLTLVGFYFLLAFVGATIPAGIYAKVHYGTSLANVDWLHGGAESLLTITNLLVVLGLRKALRKFHGVKKDAPLARSKMKERSSV